MIILSTSNSSQALGICQPLDVNLYLWFVSDRVGSEFWQQQEAVGNDLTGLQ